MPRGRKKKNFEDKIATIGDYVSPKVQGEEVPPEEEVKEEVPPTEAPPEEAPPVEKLKELTPEELKEKIVKLISEVGSRGLTEEEKIKFIEDFKFFNGVLFELLDISNNLKGILSKAHPTLTPGQALLVYFVVTGGLIVVLRPDLQAKLFKKKPEVKPVEKEEVKEEKPPEEEITKIPKEAPKPKL